MKTNRSGLDLHLGLSFLIRIVFKNIYNDLCKHCFSANLGQQYYTEYAKKKKKKKKKKKTKKKKKKKKKKNGMVWSGYILFFSGMFLRLFTVIGVLIWSGTTVLSQFEKKTFCSDQGQRCLFGPVCPINNGNYGLFLNDPVSFGTLYYINSQSWKIPIEPKRCKTFRVAKSRARKRCENSRVVKQFPETCETSSHETSHETVR